MKLRERGSAERTCPLCHDALSEDEASSCSSCRAAYHPECREEIGRCPTLGCRARPVSAARRPVRIDVAPLEVTAAPAPDERLVDAPPQVPLRWRVLGAALAIVGAVAAYFLFNAGFVAYSPGLLLASTLATMTAVVGLALALADLFAPEPSAARLASIAARPVTPEAPERASARRERVRSAEPPSSGACLAATLGFGGGLAVALVGCVLIAHGAVDRSPARLGGGIVLLVLAATAVAGTCALANAAYPAAEARPSPAPPAGLPGRRRRRRRRRRGRGRGRR